MKGPSVHYLARGHENTACGKLSDDAGGMADGAPDRTTDVRRRVTCESCLRYHCARPREHAIADCKRCRSEFVYVVASWRPGAPLYCAPCESERAAKVCDRRARSHRAKIPAATARRDAFVAELKRRGWTTKQEHET